ncbi:MAG: hypothetical protein [Chaetfec virus UA24_2735]|nr:MAG: hypothetical protein [Chaetfec virus UA24_2735]
MVVKSFWDQIDVPAHSTSDEILTVSDEAISIEELFYRAARGDSLGGADDFDFDDDEDSDIDEILHSPEYADPLLQRSLLNNLSDNVADEVSRTIRKRSKKKTGATALNSDSKEERNSLDGKTTEKGAGSDQSDN